MGAVIREGNWKLIWDFEDDKTYLNNLKEDIAETRDVALEHPENRNRLLAKLKDWQIKTDAEMPSKN